MSIEAQQWHLRQIRAPQAWAITQGEGVVVSVIDSGSGYHPNLLGRWLAGWNFVEGDSNTADRSLPDITFPHHGTGVASLVAANRDGQGGAGVAPQARVQPLRVIGSNGYGTYSAIAQAIAWASGGQVAGVPQNPTPARVINISIGGPGSVDSGVQSAVNVALSHGVTVVVSAGNDNQDAATGFLSATPGVITVGALMVDGRRTNYSNYGPRVDIAAPVGIRDGEFTDVNRDGRRDTIITATQTPQGKPTYGYFWGTSGAAPIVTGVAALMYAAKPGITPAQVRQILKETATPFSTLISEGLGAGIVNAEAAVKAARDL